MSVTQGAATQPAPVLEVRDVAVHFMARQGLLRSGSDGSAAYARAVDGVSLSLAHGEILALAGESGCGKTTLARAIMGLQPLTGGSVLVDGQDMGTSARKMREHRRRVQLIFQDPSAALDPRQNIYEAIAEGLRIQRIEGDEESLVAAALAKAGLRPPERFFLKYPHEVSGGQRQRVLIAGALALHPDVLIADEPVSALDASVRGEILQLLLALRDSMGLSMVVVTHDLGLAWMIADRVAVMYLGRIVEIAPAEQILVAPRHPYTQALLSVVPETKGMEQVILSGETPDPSRIPEGCRFHPRCPLVASGEAERLGVANRCTTEDPSLASAAAGHDVACWASALQPGTTGDA